MKMIQLTNKTIFAIAPHVDDVELGAGGTIYQLGKTNRVFYIGLSLPPLVNNDTLLSEFHNSAAILGIKPDHVILKSYDPRNLFDVRMEILQFFYDLNKQYKPDLVFIPNSKDIHQSHEVVFAEGRRARRDRARGRRAEAAPRRSHRDPGSDDRDRSARAGAPLPRRERRTCERAGRGGGARGAAAHRAGCARAARGRRELSSRTFRPHARVRARRHDLLRAHHHAPRRMARRRAMRVCIDASRAVGAGRAANLEGAVRERGESRAVGPRTC